MVMLRYIFSHIDDSVKWVVDTEATNHMIGDKFVLQTTTLVDDAGKDLSSGKVKGIGKEQDGLYITYSKKKKTRNRQKSLAVQKEVDAALWHKRMRHASLSWSISKTGKEVNVTRPDTSFAIQNLSQFMHSPKQSHMEAATRVVKYIKQSLGMEILMSSSVSSKLRAYCDADWVHVLQLENQ
ncbi:uncharacterized protein LOC107016692 [Solanum pennellii]|uniref:Uncharacterized protein LOC107016692 n=1 Tax=Solanum pennellii TaxID=28526 RepID=A0ABM1GKY4_SOLPN|nr:uncharacterized protein LOC107016692 [Solanum pennellii]